MQKQQEKEGNAQQNSLLRVEGEKLKLRKQMFDLHKASEKKFERFEILQERVHDERILGNTFLHWRVHVAHQHYENTRLSFSSLSRKIDYY